MTTEQHDKTPEEDIATLYQLVVDLESRIGDLENTIFYLRQDVSGKAGERHSHSDLERSIRDVEYHTHREYADSRHTHDRWDLR